MRSFLFFFVNKASIDKINVKGIIKLFILVIGVLK